MYIHNPTNCATLQSYIIRHSTKHRVPEEYVVYEVIGWILVDKADHQRITRQDLSRYIERLHTNDSITWSAVLFDKFKRQREESDHFLLHPFNVDEGVLECFRCHSKRTISYQRQIRSADEGATTFAQCVGCGHRWRHNN